MENKRKHIIRNSVFALRTVFRYAPVAAGVYALLAWSSSIFTVLQILFLEKLVNEVTISGEQVVFWGIAYVGALLGAKLYQFYLEKLGRYLNRSLTRSLSPAIMDKFSRIAYEYYENVAFKDVMQRMTTNPQQNVHAAFSSVVNCIAQLIKLIGILMVFFRASFWIGMGAALIGIPMAILEMRSMDKRQRLLSEATADQRMGEYLQNLFSDKHSAYEIKIFRAKEYLMNRWYETLKKINERYKRITGTLLGVQTISALLKISYTAFAVVTLIFGFLSGKISIGILVSILNALTNLFALLNIASTNISILGKRSFEVGYFREFLELKEQKSGKETLLKNHDIRFENVSFRYPGAEREVLHNLCFEIKAGEKVALVGVNGAGKSTIVKLLLGLYIPDSGRITLGGKEIHALSGEERKKALAIVFQDFGTYQLTLRENVAFGDLSKLNEDAELNEALVLAGAKELAAKGLDIPLGRLEIDGVDLSKGQWQRIAIARAFLSEADFVILDEPAASLDPIAESRLYESFSSVLKKRGSILISHRLASAKLAERILVIEGGELIEEGSHEELMKKQGLYAVMYEEQSEWYREVEI